MRRMQADNTNRVKCVIFDIDGVLLDIGPQLQAFVFAKDGTPDWQSFNMNLGSCKPIEPYFTLARALYDGGMRVELLTSRAESLRAVTEESFATYGLEYDRLWMRPEGMAHVGSKFTEAAAIMRNYDVICAFEDDPRNVATYREMGLEVVAVDSGYHTRPWVPGAESAD